MVLRGVKTKTFLFTLRMSHSGKAVHRAFATQGQEAFLEGHVYAFEQLGGVPSGRIRYDNLKAAVSRVSFGRDRTESARWLSFREHFGFDAFYCQPGVDGAHEKGGVEGEGGRFRRTHCVPMPVVDSIEELNELLERADERDDYRRITNRVDTVGADFEHEAPLLRPLPVEPFPTWLTLTPRVDRYARVTVRQCQYSVPARFIGHRVRVQLRRLHRAGLRRASGGGAARAVHRTRRPSAAHGPLPGGAGPQARRLARATALDQARKAGTFTATHEALWAAARKAHGDAGGTRALIEVLLLHRHLPGVDVLAGITAALSVGSTSGDVVAVEARKNAQQRGAEGRRSRPGARGQRVVSWPNGAWSRRWTSYPPTPGRCRRSLGTTTCSAGDVHDRRRQTAPRTVNRRPGEE